MDVPHIDPETSCNREGDTVWQWDFRAARPWYHRDVIICRVELIATMQIAYNLSSEPIFALLSQMPLFKKRVLLSVNNDSTKQTNLLINAAKWVLWSIQSLAVFFTVTPVRDYVRSKLTGFVVYGSSVWHNWKYKTGNCCIRELHRT